MSKRRSRKQRSTKTIEAPASDAPGVSPDDSPSTTRRRASLASVIAALKKPKPELRFVIVFGGLILLYRVTSLAVEKWDYAALPPMIRILADAHGFINERLVEPYQALIARISGSVLGLFDSSVRVSGREIFSDNFAVEVTHGCDAIEASLLLAAAIIAFPARITQKARGLLIGFLVVAVFNLVRVISLCFVNAHWRRGFDLIHFNLWPFLLICIIVALFLRWAQRVSTEIGISSRPAGS